MKRLLILLLFAPMCFGQGKFTAHYQLPAWIENVQQHDTLKGGSLTDTTVAGLDTLKKNYLNLLSTRVDAWLWKIHQDCLDSIAAVRSYEASLRDTIKAGINLAGISGADTTGRFYIADQSNLSAIYVRTTLSDTAHCTFNVIRDRSGTRVNLFSANQSVGHGVTTNTTLQNTAVLSGDVYLVNVVSMTAKQISMLFQLGFSKAQK